MPRQFKVTVNGREYDVTVLELTAGQSAAQPATGATSVPPPVAAAGSATTSAPGPAGPATAAPIAGSGDVVAGMGGVVVEVDVKVGQTVAAGDRLLVLEAMKMEHSVRAPAGGVVASLSVAVGTQVESGQVLAVVAEAQP